MKEKLDKIDNLGEIINDDADSDDEKEQKSNSKVNDIISNISKKSQKSNNFQEIDDFLVVLDNSEEYRKMIIEQAKKKIRRLILNQPRHLMILDVEDYAFF